MRRALLTAGGGASPLITVGNTGAFGTNQDGAYLAVDITDPASGSGTITSVKVYSPSSYGALRIVVGSVSGSTFTVRSVSASLSIGAGTVTIGGLSLPIQAGDYIGTWTGSNSWATYNPTTGTVGYNNAQTTAPTVGQQIVLATFSGRASVYGDNT